VPKDEVVRYWSILDVALIHLKKDDLFKTVIPSKMFECMGMGIPILHGVEGESADIIVDTGAGQLFEPQNPQDLVCRLKAMRANPLLRTQLAKQGHQRAAEFDRNRLANEMLLHLKIIAQQ
jgi:glycosyltransferase involved in cell wall biosynthesis